MTQILPEVVILVLIITQSTRQQGPRKSIATLRFDYGVRLSRTDDCLEDFSEEFGSLLNFLPSLFKVLICDEFSLGDAQAFSFSIDPLLV